MKAQIFKKAVSFRENLHGWKPVPSIKAFKITLKAYNSILEACGIRKRLPHDLEFEVINPRNRDYITYQLKRAERAISEGNNELFWKIATSCVKTSVSFRAAAFNRVIPQWWHEMTVSQVIILNKKIEKLIKKDNSDLEFRRVYIEKDKAKKTFRPLGVPSVSWRVVMHMWNNFLTMYLRRYMEEWNHAYMPRKGSTTAWREILLKVRKARYIYEFDINQFFPNVDINLVSDLLIEKGVPKWLVYHLENINRCAPKLPEKHLLDETVAINRYKLHTEFQGNPDPNSVMFNEVQYVPDIEQYMKEDGYDNVFEYLQAQWATLESYGIKGFGDMFKGLPQGLNTSPILSILTLTRWKEWLDKNHINLIMYADDGILYSDNEFDPEQLSKGWVDFNTSKSRWVKRNGIWDTDLNFLGIKYVPESNELRGKTRKGSTLKFGAEQHNLFDLIPKWFDEAYKKEKWDWLAETQLLGTIQAKLYNGSWDDLKGVEKSWRNHPLSWYSKAIGDLEAKGHPTMSSHAGIWLHMLTHAAMKGKLNRNTKNYLTAHCKRMEVRWNGDMKHPTVK